MAKLIFKTEGGAVLEVPRDTIQTLTCSIQQSGDGKKGVVSVHTNMRVDSVDYFNIQFQVSPIESSRILSWYTILDSTIDTTENLEVWENFNYTVGEYEADDVKV